MSKVRTEAVPVTEISLASSDMSLCSGEDLYQMVAEAAYYRAEQRGFAPGNEMDDWLEAEQDVLSSQSQQAQS